MSKYIVYGKSQGRNLYWNGEQKGWYVNDYDATVYDNEDKACNASEQARNTITVEMVFGITWKEVK